MATSSSGRTDGSRFAPGQLAIGIVIGMAICNILSSNTHPAFTMHLNTSKGQPHDDITHMIGNDEYKDHKDEGIIKLYTNETFKPKLKQRINHPKATKIFNNGTKRRPINRMPQRNGSRGYPIQQGRPYMLNKRKKGGDTNSTEWTPHHRQRIQKLSEAIPTFEPVVLNGATASHPCGKCRFIGHVKRCFKKREITDFENNKQERSTTFDGDSFCADIPLPFDNHTAKKCWPNLYILPSYPTSGNGFVQNTFTQLTNLMTMTVYGKREWGSPTIDLSSPSVATDFNEKIWYFHARKYCQYNSSTTSAILPTSGRSTLAKTHLGSNKNNNILDNIALRDKPIMTLGSTLSGVVRLARNPGDQLLRNFARWRTSKGADRSSSSAMMKRASEFCNVVLYSGVSGWMNFHQLWNTFEEMNPSVPHFILNYELISHPETATREFGKMLSFVNETAVVEDVDDLIRSIVKEPEYDQGGQFAQYCGIAAAKKLHQKTRHFSKKLGYEFDDDTGKWFLHNHQ